MARQKNFLTRALLSPSKLQSSTSSSRPFACCSNENKCAIPHPSNDLPLLLHSTKSYFFPARRHEGWHGNRSTASNIVPDKVFTQLEMRKENYFFCVLLLQCCRASFSMFYLSKEQANQIHIVEYSSDLSAALYYEFLVYFTVHREQGGGSRSACCTVITVSYLQLLRQKHKTKGPNQGPYFLPYQERRLVGLYVAFFTATKSPFIPMISQNHVTGHVKSTR